MSLDHTETALPAAVSFTSDSLVPSEAAEGATSSLLSLPLQSQSQSHSPSPSPSQSPSRSPVVLPRRTAAEALLAHRLYGGLHWRGETEDAGAIELDLRWAAPPDAYAHAAPPLWLDSAHGPIGLPDATLLTLLSGVQVPDGLCTDETLELLRLAGARWPLELVEILGGPWTPRPADMRAVTDLTNPDAAIAEAPANTPLTARLTVTAEGESHAFLLHADRATWQRWTAQPHWRPAPARSLPTALAAVRLQGSCHLGSLQLPAHRLSHLRRGDALWWAPTWGGSTGISHLVIGGGLMHLSQSDAGSSTFEGWGAEGVRSSNLSHGTPHLLEPSNVDGLKVDLDFLAGSLSMTIGELSALVPGQVLPLQQLSPPQVRIVAHGTELGRGQLIEVEGRLAVEILEWGAAR